MDMFRRRMLRPGVAMFEGARLRPTEEGASTAFDTSNDWVDYLYRPTDDRPLAVVQWAERCDKRRGRPPKPSDRMGASVRTERRVARECGVPDRRITATPSRRTIARRIQKAKHTVGASAAGRGTTGVGGRARQSALDKFLVPVDRGSGAGFGSRGFGAGHPQSQTHVSVRRRRPRVCCLFPWWKVCGCAKVAIRTETALPLKSL